MPIIKNYRVIADSGIPAVIARDTEFQAADASHLVAADPHPQYLQQAEGDARYPRLNVSQSFDGTTKAVGKSEGSISQSGQTNKCGFEIQSLNANSAAYLSFHRPGLYAVHLGLDIDNQFKLGGWSLGNISFKLWHEGNLNIANYPQFFRQIFTGNCPSSANSTTSISLNGLTPARIKSFTAFATLYANTISEMRIQPGGGAPAWIGSNFYYSVDIGSQINIRSSTNSSTVAGAPVTIVVDYL